ncbi:substrate-binding periplasmic protein [Aliikangiella marina]|uniref:substrate-binding periplasmic protein n=1 Tax=Aliikangiella marina TaxID=1712262 RepID=UPI00163DB625|nr:transporter substrate-binding domain-containing protein [Aliikangiella marina]
MLKKLNQCMLNVKHMRRCITVMLGLVGLIVSPNNYAKEAAQKLRIVSEVWEPYQFLDQSNKPQGFVIDLLDKLFAEAGLPSQEIEFYPWVRAYNIALKEKNTLILSLSRTPQRENHFFWIGKVNSEYFTFFALKSNQTIQPVESFDQLYQYRIVVTKNSAMEQYINKHPFPNVERTFALDEGYKLIARNRADLMLKAPSAREPKIKFGGYSEKDLKPIYTPDNSRNDFYIALSKGSDPRLILKIEKAFHTLAKAGKIEALKEKWHL